MRASACELYVVAACDACWLVMLAALRPNAARTVRMRDAVCL
eukprot:COSAG02_NODE_17551_length_995_cov_104.005580_1_plen_41_part_10